MHRVSRSAAAAVLALSGALAATAQTPTPSPTPAPAAAPLSPEERIQRLEKLLAETRSELAEIKAASTGAATDAKLAEIERKVDILAQEIEAMKLGEAAASGAPPAAPGEAPAVTAAAAPPSPRTEKQSLDRFGLGLSASKVYGIKRGVSIGGYGEALYQNFSSTNQSDEPSDAEDQITLLRAVVYLGYKFNEHFVLNSEIEYENAVVAADKGGEVSVEFAYLDYMHSRELNARAGLVLLPVGLVNELHEPTAFLGALRPGVDDVIIPTTWRELGGGLYGELGPFAYRAYAVNGLNAAGFTPDEGIREGRSEGSEAPATNFAVTARLDYTAVPGLLVGASVFSGDSGQGQFTPSGQKISGLTTLWDAHADWRWRGLWLRGVYARTTIAQADLINQLNGLVGDESIGSVQEGWYLQGAFDLFSLKSGGSRAALMPFVRYEQYDTQAQVPLGYARNPENDRTDLTLGLAYKPIDQIIFKADWQQRHNAARTGVNQWNMSLGYIF